MGNGFIELNFKGQSQRVSAGDIQTIQVAKGEMTITLNDAEKGLFSSRGVFKVGVSKTSDFRLMILLIERELGIRVY